MEIKRDNDFKVMNLRSVKRVKDEFKDGDLPDWLIVEFLIRLPQKVVFRLKLVSKQWLSIISEPYFIRTYCSRALSNQKVQPWIFIPSFRRFLVDENIYIPLWELLVDTYSSNLKWPYYYSLSLPCLPHPNENKYSIYGVSNGLVLYGPIKEFDGGFWKTEEFRICNPVTGQWISLPYHSNLQDSAIWGLMTNVEDGVLMSYTLVCLKLNMSTKNQSNSITFNICFSEVGKWKKYTVPFKETIDNVRMSTCAVSNGVMNWMLARHGLIAYDPHKHPDRIRFIPWPGEPKINVTCHIFAAYQGQLRFFESSLMNDDSHELRRRFRIWVLKDYSSGDWCLQHQVNTHNIQYSTTLSDHDLTKLYPVSFDPYDSNIVYIVLYEKLVFTYNIKTRKLEVVDEFREVQGKRLSFDWMHLLLIPPWPVSFSRPTVSASESGKQLGMLKTKRRSQRIAKGSPHFLQNLRG